MRAGQLAEIGGADFLLERAGLPADRGGHHVRRAQVTERGPQAVEPERNQQHPLGKRPEVRVAAGHRNTGNAERQRDHVEDDGNEGDGG